MSRKTTSEQDNQVTLLSELKKELAVYITRFSALRNRFLEKYPRQVFAAMLICMITSIVLAFSVMRHQKIPAPSGMGRAGSEVASGMGQILSTGASLKEVLELQGQIGAILKKDSLGQTDSLMLKEAFRRLESIHQKLNPKP